MGLTKGLAATILAEELRAVATPTTTARTDATTLSAFPDTSTTAIATATTSTSSSTASTFASTSTSTSTTTATATGATTTAKTTLGLFQARTIEYACSAKTVVCDLSEMVYGFPRLANEWLDRHCSKRAAAKRTLRAATLNELARKCVDENLPIGAVKKTAASTRHLPDSDSGGRVASPSHTAPVPAVVDATTATATATTTTATATTTTTAPGPGPVTGTAALAATEKTDGGREGGVETTVRRFTPGMLSAWLQDELVDRFPRRDQCMQPFANLERIYYVIDGAERPRAKAKTTAKRETERLRVDARLEEAMAQARLEPRRRRRRCDRHCLDHESGSSESDHNGDGDERDDDNARDEVHDDAEEEEEEEEEDDDDDADAECGYVLAPFGCVERFLARRSNVLELLRDMHRRLQLTGGVVVSANRRFDGGKTESRRRGGGRGGGRGGRRSDRWSCSPPPLDAFVVMGSDNVASPNSWFRLVGASRDAQRPLERYAATRPRHLEADEIIPRIAELVRDAFSDDGPVLVKTSDSDMLATLLALDDDGLVWGARLSKAMQPSSVVVPPAFSHPSFSDAFFFSTVSPATRSAAGAWPSTFSSMSSSSPSSSSSSSSSEPCLSSIHDRQYCHR